MASMPRIKIAALAAVGAAAVAVSTVVATPSGAASGPAPVTSGARYLALGDSIPFGFREGNAVNQPDNTKPANLVGYPNLVAKDLGLRLTNAACPGETAAAFIKVGNIDNGCHQQADGSPPGYRTVYPLHTQYTDASQSQLDFAKAYLTAHPDTKLVTLQVGANDGLRCLFTTCSDATSQAKVLAAVQKRLTVIFNTLINNVGYKGQFVLVNYYSVESSIQQQNDLATAVNAAERQIAVQYPTVTIADSYTRWRQGSENSGGDTCAAGLETITTSANPLTGKNCGIHPSLAGHGLIATAVERVVKKS